MTTIKLKNGSGAPTAGDLAQGEPALDLTNKRLYTEDSGGTVIEVGTNPTSVTTGDITATGTATFAGLTTTADVSFGDNDKAIFGAGNDLSVYHDGSNSYIKEEGTGNLEIGTNGGNITLKNLANSETLALFNINSGVNLYYDNAVKLETTSTGIDVTGTVSANNAEIGSGGASNTNAFIDLTGDTTYTDFGFRMVRNSGANGKTELRHRGTGDFTIEAVEAGAIAFETSDTERMRIDSSGNVGIGKTPNTNFSGYVLQLNGGSQTFMSFGNSTTGTTLTDGLVIGNDNSGADIYQREAQPLRFHTSNTERMRIKSDGEVEISGIGNTTGARLNIGSDANNAFVRSYDTSQGMLIGATNAQPFKVMTNSLERMRITSSGNLLVGTTSVLATTKFSLVSTGNGFAVQAGNGSVGSYMTNTSGTANWQPFSFNNNGTSFSQIGSITCTASATAFNTSSDQRLKDNIVDAPSASEDIDAIQVRSFDWKADGSHQKYGMVAQELQSVAPEAVSEGATEEDMMGVDYSKLVPMLVKEIQSLRARVAQLEGEA